MAMRGKGISTRSLLTSAAGVAALLSAGLAMAQEAGPGALEEVVVTARRQSERAQSVPISITTFSQAEMERKRVVELRDIARFSPSLAVSQNGSDAFKPFAANVILRGLPATVTYFSQVPIGAANPAGLSGPAAVPGHYLDLDHAEVVKGPQGTLFGTNALGGAILLEPKRPTDTFGGSVQIGLGNYNDREANGVVNFPLVEGKLLVRIAGAIQTRDGFTRLNGTDIDLDDRDHRSWRVGVTLRPSDSFENYFIYDGFRQRQHGDSVILDMVSPTGLASTLFGFQSLLAQQQALGPRVQVGRDAIPYSKADVWGVTDIASWNVTDNLTLKNIAAIRVVKATVGSDLDGTAAPLLNIGPTFAELAMGDFTTTRQYTEEFQGQGSFLDDRLNLTVGGFLSYVEPAGPQLRKNVTVGAAQYQVQKNAARSQAIYAQGIYEVVDDLKFTAGFRYNWDHVSNQTRATTAAGACVSNVFADANCVQFASGKFKAPGWTLGLDYQIQPETLLYVRSGHAYQAGFANLGAPSPQFALVKPQKVTDAEIGIKTDFTLGDVRGRLNADLFYAWFTDIAVNQLVQFTNAAGQTQVNLTSINAGKAYAKGFETELTLRLPRGFDVMPYASLVKTAYTRYPVVAPATSAPPVIYVPEWKYGASATWHLPVDARLGDLSVTAAYSWVDRFSVSTVIGDPGAVIPSSGRLDLQVNWTDIGAYPIDLNLFMTNATDKLIVTGRNPLMPQLGFDTSSYGEPRMYGVKLRYRFGGE